MPRTKYVDPKAEAVYQDNRPTTDFYGVSRHAPIENEKVGRREFAQITPDPRPRIRDDN